MRQLRRGIGNNQPSTAASKQNSVNHHFDLTKPSGLKLAGFFIILAIIGLAGASVASRDTESTGKAGNKAASSLNEAADANVQASSNSQATSSQPSLSQSSSTTSDQSTVTNSAGSSSGNSTQVSVNGQSVNVPANGSIQQTINTPGGSTTVDVSHSQTSVGSSSNSNDSSTQVNVDSSTSSNSGGN